MNEAARASFQIHLSTAIVMMFVAGGLMWANLCPRNSDMPIFNPPYRYDTEYETLQFGVPFGAVDEVSYTVGVNGSHQVRVCERSYSYYFAIFDALFALGVLFAVWSVCEWLIRRRAVRMERK